jgi:predicted amidophosphoribosyltransferase
MSKQMMRVYQNFEFDQVKEHLLEYGVLSGICAKCKHMNIKLEDHTCPACGTEFKYVAFQNIREHLPKMVKLHAQRPSMQFIDHQDFKRIEAETKARSILG